MFSASGFSFFLFYEDYTNIQRALEAADLNMKAQLELYFPKGLNLRSEDIMERRMEAAKILLKAKREEKRKKHKREHYHKISLYVGLKN